LHPKESKQIQKRTPKATTRKTANINKQIKPIKKPTINNKQQIKRKNINKTIKCTLFSLTSSTLLRIRLKSIFINSNEKLG
jgi:hypothetical protein